MSRTQSESLGAYAEKCRELKRDLEHVLIDLEFTQEQGGRIHYAVDFSEIYAYVAPGQTAEEFSLFADDPKSWTDFLQRLALRRLFDDSSEKLILLEPYAIELQNFRRMARRQALDNIVNQTPDLFKEREKLMERPEFAQILELSEKAESGIALTHEENSNLITFLQQNAPSLLAFYERQDVHSFNRLIDLFNRQRFDDLENLVEIDRNFISEPDQHWEYWYETIAKQRHLRSRAASLLDAKAIALVEQANRVLQSQNVKLLLVTRSATMHNGFAQLSPRSVGRSSDSSLLRHPRIFSVFSVEGIPTEYARQQLQEQLENVNVFLEVVEKHENSAIGETSGNESLLDEQLELLSRIKKAWHSTEALRASLSEAISDEGSHSWRQNRDEIRGITQLLRSDEALQRLIVERLNELTESLALEHLQLGGYIQGSDPEQQDFLIDYLVAEDFGTKYVLKVLEPPRLGELPYSLEFYTDEAKLLLLDFTRDSKPPSEKRPKRREILSFFQQGLSIDAEYEPLLVMAYVLGVLEQWKLAERYCEWALEIARKGADVLEHEGKFFLAICMRRVSPSVARHRKAINLIDEAMKLKAEVGGAEPDPRYLKEKALHILLLNTGWIEEGGDEFPHPDEALELLDRAYEGSENDPILRIGIVINRLYYFVETGQIDKHKARVKTEYLELEKWQEDIELDDSKWSIFVIDTIAWTRWNLLDLLGADNASEKKLIVEQLERVVRRSSGKDRERCLRHLDAVREGKRRQNWIALRANHRL